MTIKKPGDWFTEEIADKEHVIRATFLHWMAAHGAMCLALRHPQMTGASRELIVDMINGIELLFKIKGMPQEQLKQMHLIESDAGSVERTADETAIESIDNWNESEKRASFYTGGQAG